MNTFTTHMGSSLGRRVRAGSTTLLAAGLLLLLLGVAGGCSVLPEPKEDPTRYYLLSAEPTSAAAAPAPGEERKINVGVRVVELPGYLRNHRTLVVRNGVNEVKYQDYARWAEPLDVAVQRIVRDRLMGNPAVATAEVAPFTPEVRRDLDVSVRVFRCEGGIDEAGRRSVQFSAVYEIARIGDGGRVEIRKSFSAPPATWDGSDYSQLAARLAEAVAALGDDIAGSLPR